MDKEIAITTENVIKDISVKPTVRGGLFNFFLEVSLLTKFL